MSEYSLILILLLSPLVGFLVNGLRFQCKNYKLAGTIATSAVFISFLSSITLFFKLSGMGDLAVGSVAGVGETNKIVVNFFEWISLAGFTANASFTVDAISSIMILIITGVGTLIHLFSIGYMSHDQRPTKYFAYLNFFIFNMLLLVLGSNLLVMFVGWEGVGLSSYLLIGFWFTDKEKATAGMKAFLTNRIGDAGFLLGIFFLFMTFGTVDFAELISRVGVSPEIGWSGPITLACLFLFIGATGKSAQIPLHVWLPDAMAGPTPVSALIHAATMVTAGVYMIIRLSPVFVLAPNVMMVIAVIGGLTAVFAASIALTQWDIKKVLAYSTVSQLGFMFLAAGVGAFSAAMFHLMTHAFFKALMFLGSGSVIHAMSDEQDMRKMGGLKKYMPITYMTFICGWVAIIGIPPFAGFFSKDEILWSAFASGSGHWVLWTLGAVAALLTAFYMTRLMALTFWGKENFSDEVHPHESPVTMTIPLIVLAVLSVTAGWLGIPHIIGESLGHIPNFLDNWLHGSVVATNIVVKDHGVEIILMVVSTLGAICSALLAYYFYIVRPEWPKNLSNTFSKTHRLFENKYFVDEIYFGKVINPLIDLSKGLWYFIDVKFIDRITYIVSDLVKGAGSFLKSLQNGNLQHYASFILYGLVGVLVFIIFQMG